MSANSHPMSTYEEEVEEVDSLSDMDGGFFANAPAATKHSDDVQDVDAMDEEMDTGGKDSESLDAQVVYECFCKKTVFTPESLQFHVKRQHKKFVTMNEHWFEENLVHLQTPGSKTSKYQLYQAKVKPDDKKNKKKGNKATPVVKPAPSQVSLSHSSIQERAEERLPESKPGPKKQPTVEEVEAKRRELQQARAEEKRLMKHEAQLNKQIAQCTETIKKYEEMIRGFQQIIKALNLSALIGKDIDI